MRVTMLNKYYPPHLGGIEFHVRDLASGLAKAGSDVRVLVANEGSNEITESVDGIEVHRLPRTFAYASTPVAPSMRSAIRAEELRVDPPDVLHLHFPYPWGEFSWLTARTDIPTVMTYHSDIVRQRKLLAAYRPVLNRVLDAVDLIIASSPNMVEHSEFLAPRADKCRVVPFGIDVDQFAATPERVARAKELRAPFGDRPVVLFVGRFVYYKGVDVLMRAIPDVEAQFVLIGTGPLEAELREMAVARGVEDRVLFLPSQPFDDLVAWFRAADVLCLPSTARSEAFGLVQIEAHASGTPVVSTDLTTGVPFANQDGVTGLTVPVGDTGALAGALRRLVDDPELRARMGRDALERARRDFTIPRMASDVLSVYDEAIGLHAGGKG